jgi:hypothetical protein
MIRQERQCCGLLGFDLEEGREVVTPTITAPHSARGVRRHDKLALWRHEELVPSMN